MKLSCEYGLTGAMGTHKDALMRTTIELPDHLFRQAQEWATREGVSLEELMTRLVARELATNEVSTAQRPRADDLPTFPELANRQVQALTSAEIEDLLTEEDAQRVGAGRGNDH